MLNPVSAKSVLPQINPVVLRRRFRSAMCAKSRGFSVVGWLLMMPVVLITLLIVAIGFYEGRKAYWDAKVREMCEKDGRIAIYERVVLTRTEYDRLGGKQGMIPLPSERSVSAGYPLATRTVENIFREYDPRVYREETSYIRMVDMKLLARTVRYWRVGGDFPTFAHTSYFSCPDQKEAVAEERAIFVIEGGRK